jgi:hypothetical protein
VQKHHDDRPPGALARGVTKPSDIERVRGDIRQAEQHVACSLHAAIARRGHRPSTRGEPRHGRIAATAGPWTRPVSAGGARPIEPSPSPGAKPVGDPRRPRDRGTGV